MFRMSEHSFDETIRTEIRAEMARQKITQRQLATRLDWPHTKLHRRLTGTSPLGAEDLYRIAKALHVTVADLGFPVLNTTGRRAS